jgi:hypothetical protein
MVVAPRMGLGSEVEIVVCFQMILKPVTFEAEEKLE